MMLDTATLRVAFGVVAFTMLVLFYCVTYRSTRSSFCGWWCVALALFLTGSAAYLLNGTAQQVWANPAGNALAVLGGAATWAGATTLRGTRPPLWQLTFAPILILILSSLDNPSSNIWSGGYIFLLAMSVMIGLSAFELWRVERNQTRIQLLLAATAGLTSVYYFARWIVYLIEGPDGVTFTTYFGSATTTLLNLILLAVVSYSMSKLSYDQFTMELTTRATRDGMTGLLNRTEFLRLATLATRNPKRSLGDSTLILADLDHFKDINDGYGHTVGDHVLQAFAAACTESVRSTDLVGRYGGEEFILLLPGMTLDRAEQTVEAINGRLRNMPEVDGARPPTVSYGLGRTAAGTPLHETIAAADTALYQAKRLGRNRVARVGDAASRSDRLSDSALLDEQRGKIT